MKRFFALIICAIMLFSGCGAVADVTAEAQSTNTDAPTDVIEESDEAIKDEVLPSGGIDKILEANDILKITVLEDTYVQGGSYAGQNFGNEEVIENKAISKNGETGGHRISLFKFDISSLDRDFKGNAKLLFNVFDMQDSAKPRTINIYACDPYAWEEDKVTYNTMCELEELIATVSVVGYSVKTVDITDYVKKALKYGDDLISICFEGDPETEFRTRIDSSEKKNGIAPYLSVTTGNMAFSTKLEYDGENPWDVAAEAVSTWLGRWEIIKQSGSENVETIVKDKDEYSLTVGGAKASDTDGANTKYTEFPTRIVGTLKGYEANISEVELYDEYGGFMGGERYEATGFFYTKKIGDRWWNIDPLGYPHYRMGVVELSAGSSTAQQRATFTKYGDKKGWGEAVSDRLYELGFNSAGGWSDIATLTRSCDPLSQTQIFNVLTSYAKSIGIEVSTGGNPLPSGDIIPAFDPDFATFTFDRVKTMVSPYAGDPSVYGWMSDNEICDNIKMLDHALALDHTDKRYAYTYAVAWTFMYLKTGKADVSTEDITDELREEFIAMTYDKYFEVVTAALDKYDPYHMYMGCRFVSKNYKRESVMRVAGYWCDVVTFNYYGVWEGDPTLMANIGTWLGETPFVVTEWYAKGMDVWEKDNRITNKSGAGWTVRTQDDRGKFYQNYALMLMECKDCVGFDWFKYWDNDPTNLEADPSNRNANKGLYSNDGEEYTVLSGYMEELNTQKYNIIKFFDER